MATQFNKYVLEIVTKADRASVEVKALTREVNKLTAAESRLEKIGKTLQKGGQDAVDMRKRLAEATDNVTKKTHSFTAALNKFKQTALTITSAGVVFYFGNRMVNALDKAISSGFKFNQVMASMAFDIGQAEKATLGLISKFELAKYSNQAFATGAAKSSEGFAEMAKQAMFAAKRMGRDFDDALDRIITSIGKLEIRKLDELGVTIRLNDVNKRLSEKYKIIGKNASVAMKQEEMRLIVLEKLAEANKTLIDQQDTLGNQWQKAKVALENAANAASGLFAAFNGGIGILDAIAGKLNKLTMSLRTFQTLMATGTVGEVFGSAFGLGSYGIKRKMSKGAYTAGMVSLLSSSQESKRQQGAMMAAGAYAKEMQRRESEAYAKQLEEGRVPGVGIARGRLAARSLRERLKSGDFEYTISDELVAKIKKNTEKFSVQLATHADIIKAVNSLNLPIKKADKAGKDKGKKARIVWNVSMMQWEYVPGVGVADLFGGGRGGGAMAGIGKAPFVGGMFAATRTAAQAAAPGIFAAGQAERDRILQEEWLKRREKLLKKLDRQFQRRMLDVLDMLAKGRQGRLEESDEGYRTTVARRFGGAESGLRSFMGISDTGEETGFLDKMIDKMNALAEASGSWKESTAAGLNILTQGGVGAINAFADGLWEAFTAHKSLGAALKESFHIWLKGFGKQMMLEAMSHTAKGIAALFIPGKQAEAGGYFKAAGIFGAAAVAAGFGARATATPGASGAKKGGVSRGLGGVPELAQRGPEQSLVFNINTVMTTADEEQFARMVGSGVNIAKSRGYL